MNPEQWATTQNPDGTLTMLGSLAAQEGLAENTSLPIAARLSAARNALGLWRQRYEHTAQNLDDEQNPDESPGGPRSFASRVEEFASMILAEADHELAGVNAALRSAGIEYPLGARGVAGLADLHQAALNRAKETADGIAAMLDALAEDEIDAERSTSFSIAAEHAREYPGRQS